MRVQDLLTEALAVATGPVVAVLTERYEANLRWAANALTTNGEMHARSLAVTATAEVEGGTAVATVAADLADVSEVAAVVAAAEAAARSAAPADEPVPFVADDGQGGVDFDEGPATTSVETLTTAAAGLGRAFARAEADGHLLYGFAEHIVETVYLASSTGLRRRGVDPEGRLELNGKSADLGSRSASDDNPAGGVGGRPPTQTSSGSRSASDDNPAGGRGGSSPHTDIIGFEERQRRQPSGGRGGSSPHTDIIGFEERQRRQPSGGRGGSSPHTDTDGVRVGGSADPDVHRRGRRRALRGGVPAARLGSPHGRAAPGALRDAAAAGRRGGPDDLRLLDRQRPGRGGRQQRLRRRRRPYAGRRAAHCPARRAALGPGLARRGDAAVRGEHVLRRRDLVLVRPGHAHRAGALAGRRRAARAGPQPRARGGDRAARDARGAQPGHGRRGHGDARGDDRADRARAAADLLLVHPRGRPRAAAADRSDPRRGVPRRARRGGGRGEQLPLERVAVELLGRVTEVGASVPVLCREWNDYLTKTVMPPLRVPDFNMSTVSQAS